MFARAPRYSAEVTQLTRTLGPVMIWGLGVGYVISGMYFGWNLGLPEGGPYGMLVATAGVTLLYITFVLGYAELACALPRAGGVFVYTSRAFGPQIGFVGGIAQLVEYVLAPPAIAFAIGSYVNQTHPDLPILGVAVGAYIVFTIINIVGVKLSATFELILCVVAVVELCVFGAIALPKFSWEKFSADALPHGWGGAFAAIPFAMWFYLAIEGIANVAEEAKNPQRDLPRGFLLAMATLVVLTVVTLFGAVGVNGWQAVVYPTAGSTVTSDSPLPLAIAHVVSRESPFFVVLTSIGLIGLIASFHGILIVASRSLMELGRVRYVPAALGRVNENTKTPVVALIVNLVVGLIVLFTGRTADIILISVFGALTLYIMSSAAVIKLRFSEPELARPYKTPLYPLTPILALVLAIVATVAMTVKFPGPAAAYLGILGVTLVLFGLFVPESARTRFAS